jgi:hypothetical protein
MFFRWLFVLFLLAIALYVLYRFINFDYPCGIITLFLSYLYSIINLTGIICYMAECACPKGGTGLPTSYAPVCLVFGTRVFVAGVELFFEQK